MTKLMRGVEHLFEAFEFLENPKFTNTAQSLTARSHFFREFHCKNEHFTAKLQSLIIRNQVSLVFFITKCQNIS